MFLLQLQYMTILFFLWSNIASIFSVVRFLHLFGQYWPQIGGVLGLELQPFPYLTHLKVSELFKRLETMRVAYIDQI